MRRTFAESIERRTGEARSRREAAERLARVRRDYQNGKLDPEDWSEQRAELRADQEAAEKEAAGLALGEEPCRDGAPGR